MRWTESTSEPSDLYISPIITANMKQQSMRIPISLLKGGRTVEAEALVDSGATGIFIDSRFMDNSKLHSMPLSRPIPVRNVDGSSNQLGRITRCVSANIKIGKRSSPIEMLVTHLGKEDVILGLPWLRSENPNINWETGKLTLRN